MPSFPPSRKQSRRHSGRQLQLRIQPTGSRRALFTHFSSDEYLAGQQAGKRAKDAGATKILCTIQQTGSVALEDRARA
jgi:hypothetical protein